MYFIFIDEAGSPYRNYSSYKKGYAKKLEENPRGPFPRYPFFILAALGIQEFHLPIIDDWFAGIKVEFLGSSTDAIGTTGQEYEIKGGVLYALLEGKYPGEWIITEETKPKKQKRIEAQKAVWRPLQQRQLEKLQRSIFDVFRRLRPMVWVIVVKQHHIFKRHRDKTWCPYDWALTLLHQRAVHHVQTTQGAYQRAIFLMDETSTLATATDFERFLKTRQTINATARWPVDFSRFLIDIPVIGKSHLHQALQLADVIAHGVLRLVGGRDSLGWFAQIEPFLAKHWSTGGYKNAGLTFIQ